MREGERDTRAQSKSDAANSTHLWMRKARTNESPWRKDYMRRRAKLTVMANIVGKREQRQRSTFCSVIYVYWYIHIYMYIYINIYIYVYTFIYMYMYLYIYIS